VSDPGSVVIAALDHPGILSSAQAREPVSPRIDSVVGLDP